MFCKKGVLRNFAEFTGKYLYQSRYFKKGLRPAPLLKQRLWRRCFLKNFAKFLRTPFLTDRFHFVSARNTRGVFVENMQMNICFSLVKKVKRNYYENLDLKDNNDNKKFWATAKPLFSNKIKSAENIF